MATPTEELLRAIEALQTILGDPEALGKLNPATKTAMQMVLPGVRQAANIETGAARSTLRIGEEREKEGIRIRRLERRQGMTRIGDAQKRLATAAKRFVDTRSTRITGPALREARDNLVRMGGTPDVAQGTYADAVAERRIKVSESVGKQRGERRTKQTETRRRIAQESRVAGPEARRGRLTRLGLTEERKIPGGGTLGGVIGQRKPFLEALKKVQGRRTLVKGGLLGGAAAVGIPLLLKMMGGAKKQAGAELPPEVQMQLMQAMAGGGGGQGVDPALSTGRNLRNVFQLLQIIKTITDMQGLQQQPTGGLV